MGDEEKRPLLDRCPVKIVDGHFEHDCETKEDRDELTAVYEREAILRVKPAGAIREEAPVTES